MQVIESKDILGQMASVSYFSPVDVLKVIFWFTVAYVSLTKLFLCTLMCIITIFLVHRQLSEI